MAMVRMTMDIIYDVEHQLTKIYDEKVATAYGKHGRNWGRRAYDICMSRYEDQLAQTPTDFLSFTESLTLSGIRGVAGDTRSFSLTQSLGDRLPWPVNTKSTLLTPYLDVTSYYSNYVVLLPVPSDPQWMALYSEVYAWLTAYVDTMLAKTRVMSTARRVLDANSTIKGAVEDWPALIDLLPGDVVRKHNAPAEPRKKREVPPKPVVDTSNLNDLTTELALKRLTR